MSKIKAGTTSFIKDIAIDDSSSSTGTGLASLVYNTAGLVCKYKRRGDSSWTTLTLNSATAGTYTSGGFVAATGAPNGDYELHIPNAAIASGTTAVVFSLYGATNMAPCRFEIELDKVDYQDDTRFGLTAIPNANAGANGGLVTVDANNAVKIQSGTGTNQVLLTDGQVTVGTNSDKTGYALSASGIQGIWDRLTSSLTTTNSIGKYIIDNLNATITSRMATFSYTAPDNSSISSIKAKTDNLPSDPASVSDIPSVSSIADAVWDESSSGHVDSGTYGAKVVEKTGFKLASDGLDTISTASPSGVATNFREMIIQLWRRWFKKVDMTSSQLRTYADNNTTVITTQSVSDNGTTQVVDRAL